jgi:hypothetical protein
MLDYYGSITKDNQAITRELVDHFKDYKQNYIEEIIDFLRTTGILPMSNSVSGWMVFGSSQMVTEIKSHIYNDTLLRKKIVSFVMAANSLNIETDIIREIYHKLRLAM